MRHFTRRFAGYGFGAVVALSAGCAVDGGDLATSAQDLTWSGATLLEESPGAAEQAAVAVDAVGNGVAVWSQNGHLNARRYTLGGVWSAPFVATPSAGDIVDYDVAMRPNGEAFVVWTQQSNAYVAPSTREVWAGRLTSAGWGNTQRIASHASGRPWLVHVVTSANGDAFAVWSVDHESDQERSVNFASRYTPGGGWGVAHVLAPPSPGAHRRPSHYPAQIAVDPNGNAVAAWQEWSFAPGHPQVWAARYVVRGGGWYAAERVDDNDANSPDEDTLRRACAPSVGIDSSGRATVVWEGDERRVFASHSALAGGWSAPRRIDERAGPTPVGVMPQVAVSANGNAVAVWLGSTAASGRGVIANLYRDGVWSTPTFVRPARDLDALPRVGLDASGSALVTYQDWAAPSLREVRAVSYNARLPWSELSWGNDQRIGLGGSFLDRRLAVAPSGVAIASWIDFDVYGPLDNAWVAVLR